MRYFISGGGRQRPPASAVIYCDGSGDELFRDGVDLELSHWVPNRTPTRYRADTSTEICLRYVTDPPDRDFELAINNHVDVDGLLAVFVLVHPEFALRHRERLIAAAELGDFWGWGNAEAQLLFQGLTLFADQLESAGADAQTIYDRCFSRIPHLIDQSDEDVPQIQASLEPLHQSCALIESGAICRTEIHRRFVVYEIPSELAAADRNRTLYVPGFNEPISDRALLWPQARARQDEQKVTLIAAKGERGWYYDLWYPGYVWADTPNRWRPPGLEMDVSTDDHHFDHPELSAATRSLQNEETGSGSWWMAGDFSVFGEPGVVRRPFPIAVSFVGAGGLPAESSLSPERVVARISGCFT